MAIDNAHNAGLLAVRILALENPKLSQSLHKHRKKMKAKVGKSQSSLKKFLR
jgi:phosphoribosylcarboxyaminoimidazole (NCAIR) mutase